MRLRLKDSKVPNPYLKLCSKVQSANYLFFIWHYQVGTSQRLHNLKIKIVLLLSIAGLFTYTTKYWLTILFNSYSFSKNNVSPYHKIHLEYIHVLENDYYKLQNVQDHHRQHQATFSNLTIPFHRQTAIYTRFVFIKENQKTRSSQ